MSYPKYPVIIFILYNCFFMPFIIRYFTVILTNLLFWNTHSYKDKVFSCYLKSNCYMNQTSMRFYSLNLIFVSHNLLPWLIFFDTGRLHCVYHVSHVVKCFRFFFFLLKQLLYCVVCKTHFFNEILPENWGVSYAKIQRFLIFKFT